MEYRCYILGDTIAEPGALLRRLLYDPFPESEQRALTHRSLLQVRAEESKSAAAAVDGSSTHTSSMAVSVPELNAPRTGAVTLPNPSMPSVDVTLQFGVITEPRELERVMLSHYTASASVTGGSGRSLRRRATSPGGSSSGRDGSGAGGGNGVSSETSSVTHHGVAATGLALRAPPHALVLVFNPFSLSSFLRLRMEWAHTLQGLRQQRQAQLDYLHAHQQQQQLYQSDSSGFQPRNASTASLMGSSTHLGHGKGATAGTAATPTAMFLASPNAPSPLSPALPMDAVEGFPPVLLVGARMELMREAMEATPSIRLPSSSDVAEVAQGLQAPVYLEVGTDWDDTMDVLRATIARGCMGELATASAVTFDAAYQSRQGTIARAMEEVHANPCEGDEDGEDGPRLGAFANGSLDQPPVVSLLGLYGHSDAGGGGAAAPAAAEERDGDGTLAGMSQKTRNTDTSPHGVPAEDDLVDGEQPPRPSSGAADDPDDSKHSSRASSDHSSSARSDARNAERLESPLRGRELRRHLVHALPPLCLPQTGAAAPAAKSTWTWRRHPRTGRLFYVLRATGKSQYTLPADYDGPPPPLRVGPLADAGAEQSTTLPPSPAAAAGPARKASDRSADEEEAAPSRSPSEAATGSTTAAAAAAEQAGRAEDERGSLTVPCAPAAVGHVEAHMESDAAASVEATAPSLQGEVGAWRRRQQLQLRRARVRQLERQVEQVRGQAERLRTQSEANAEMRQRVVALRTELDAMEQSFLSRVAEQNAQLAAETMQVTQAIEELLAAPHPQLATSGARAEVAAAGTDTHRHSAVPLTCLPAETQRADAEVQEAVAALQDALNRRDAQADAVTQLQNRRARVDQRTQEAEAELTVLTARMGELDASLTSLGAQLHESQSEEVRLRERLAVCEAARAAEERRRVAALEERVAAQREADKLARALEAHRDIVTAAQDRFGATLCAFHLPSRTKRAVLMEELERLRLALEAATAQCARALLDGADRLDTATRLASDLRVGAAQLQSVRARQQRRLRDQVDAAEGAQARLVLARYTPPPAVPRGDGDNLLTDELAELNVAACAEAYAAWQAHDVRITAPLQERVKAAMRELDGLMREAQEHVGGGRATSLQLTPLALVWMGEEVRLISQAVCEACAGLQCALAHHSVDASATAQSCCSVTPTAEAGRAAPTTPSHSVTGNADTVARVLWRTCDGVVTRMPRLSPPFTLLYTSVRGV